MVGYNVPCRYCETLVEPGASYCPACSKVNPAGPMRCPVCRNPSRRQWVRCSGCGTHLKIECPCCGQETFLGDYCDHCDERLLMICSDPKCRAEQPPVGDSCRECQKPLQQPS